MPSQPCPEYSKATTDPIIEEEFPDEVPTDDEDERMHPEFVVRKPPNEDDGEDYIPPPQFEETDSDEREEDMDMGYLRQRMRVGLMCSITEMILL